MTDMVQGVAVVAAALFVAYLIGREIDRHAGLAEGNKIAMTVQGAVVVVVVVLLGLFAHMIGEQI